MQEKEKKYHLCKECYEERIKNGFPITDNLWCFHEYLKEREKHNLYIQVLKKKNKK